ncbi:autophagy-related protein 22-like protein [Xylogone sp. PMI_703]|nr:autophagy-related protein 22-like protein [Xylogone sp. PMI_703]
MVPRSSIFIDPNYRPVPQRALSSSTKQSFRSHSSSFEADDERSESDSMGPDLDAAFRRGRSQYAGEDTRLTSQKELAGWYAYGFAAEVFVICGIGSFIPITLEQLARENGVLLSDRTTPCGSSSSGVKNSGQCIVYILGWPVNTASLAMYTFSLSVLFQAILVVSISCAADHGNYRKRLLLLFAFVGSIATMLFLPVVPKVYLLGSFMAIVANTCFGASFVLLNSFLPLLVRHHPKAQYPTPELTPELHPDEPDTTPPEEPLDEVHPVDTVPTATTPLLPRATEPSSRSQRNKTSIELQLSTQISATGIGIGYSAALFLQCACIFILILMKSTTFALRVVLFVVGAWWFIFSIPAALWLRPRPGPPLHVEDQNSPTGVRTWVSYFAYSWMSLYRTVKLARKLKDVVLFLGAWFLLSDAIATVSGTAVLYAKTTLHMHNEALALINVIATSAGILGAFGWSLISKFLHLKPHQTILACIFLFELIPVYGLLGYLPIVKRWGVVGLQQPWEMYPLGFVYGFILGGLSSYCRALFGELIPPGSEAAFYALYAITDKGSSVFGPAIVGAIVDRYGEIRPAFWFLALLVGIPGPLVWFVNVERGRSEGARLAEVIEGFKPQQEEQEEGRDRALLGSDDEGGYEARINGIE